MIAYCLERADLMSLAVLDPALRGATAALLLVLAGVLLRDLRGVLAGRLAAAFALGSAAHALTSGIGVTVPFAIWHAPLIALSTGNVVVFWLFTRALFDDAFSLRWWHGLIWIAVTAFSFVNCLWIAPVASVRVSVVAVNVLVLGFIALAFMQTVSNWSADLVEDRRRLRVFIVTAAAFYGGLNALVQILVSGGEAALIAYALNAALLAGVTAAIFLAMIRVSADDLFPASVVAAHPVAPVMSSAVTPAVNGGDQKLVDALLRLMADERVYRRENLTIGMLATKLGIPEYRLRRLINQRLGYRNFNTFLNNHRIEEAKAALADPTQAEVPVITIAMDAGFQSLGPFNRAFKAETGLTPSEYRRQKLMQSAQIAAE
jgi:AraC-like DNA-binding protein